MIAYNRPPPDDVPGRNLGFVNTAGTAPGHDVRGGQRPDAVIVGHQSFEQTQIADQKSSEGAGEETVDYVDTSAYEVYEKQEGDFVEPDAEPSVEANAAAAGEEDSEAETPHKQ